MEDRFNWLQGAIMAMGKKTMAAVDKSIEAMVNNDISLAEQVRIIEKRVDIMYYAINEHCLDTLSSEISSRREVNMVANSLKIAMELERICDYANQIAKLVQKKFSQVDFQQFRSCHAAVSEMKAQSLNMLETALQSFDQLDAGLSKMVEEKDSSVDKMNRDLFRNMICLVSINPWSQETAMDYHVAVRYIERVADRATNIAELVYYMIHGEPLKKLAVQTDIWDEA
ncbi:MAG: phosphate signaling complex protein PhoU [Negativicutes bacterium]|nr:phosphate signaling complex protein PhoU [Negativicutes bacterium]